MNIKEIRELVKIVEKSSMNEFSLQEGDLKIKMSKISANQATQVQVAAEPAAVPVQATSPQTEQKVESKPEVRDNNLVEIKSPIVGTFYTSPAPDADPYVKVGDKVKEGQVLCIVEAMKLMNEIESEVNGTLAEILVENGTPVEYNQPLYLIRKN